MRTNTTSNTSYSTEKLTSIFFILSIVSFIIYKGIYLNVGYFWDESWVYGPAVSAMSETLPSLLPGSIDIDLSRGHPMLFHFLGGLWGVIFGNSVFSLHAFALTISLILLFSIYYILNKEISSLYAKIGTLLLVCQGVFLAQSAMVLPEILVALLGLWSIYLWSKEEFLKSCIFAAACILSKESGAILFPALGLSFLAHTLLTDSFSWKRSFKILFYLIVSCLPYLLFLLYQKFKFDWFFFPNHMDLQIKDVHIFKGQLKAAILFVIKNQYRLLFSIFIFCSLVWKFRNFKDFWVLISYVAIQYVSIFLLPWEKWSSLAIYSILSLSSFTLLLYYAKRHYKRHHFFYLIILIFSILYFAFTAHNFFSSRYVLIIIPLFIITGLKIISISNIGAEWLSILFIPILLIQLNTGLKRSPISDVSQAFIHTGKVQKHLFEFLEDEALYEEKFLAPFLLQESLKKVHAGYRTNKIPFIDVPYYPSPDSHFYNITSSWEGEYINQDHKTNRKIEFTKEFKHKNVWIKIEKYSAVKLPK